MCKFKLLRASHIIYSAMSAPPLQRITTSRSTSTRNTPSFDQIDPVQKFVSRQSKNRFLLGSVCNKCIKRTLMGPHHMVLTIKWPACEPKPEMRHLCTNKDCTQREKCALCQFPLNNTQLLQFLTTDTTGMLSQVRLIKFLGRFERLACI